MTRRSWIQINGKLYEKGREPIPDPAAPMVRGDIEPFVSPITGEVIRGRGHLRQHMKQHGVTHSQDYSPQFLEQRARARHLENTGQTPAARRDRIEAIKHALEKKR